MERAAGSLRATPALADGAPVMTVHDRAGVRRFPVIGTIGVAPLQQVLLDGGDGRRLVAPIAWDVQRTTWFDPASDGAVGDPADPLYWAGPAGNWNLQCAACHVTGFVKGYDADTGRYSSTYTHEGVGCEACHSGGAPLSGPQAELNVCSGCHSRRRALTCGDDPPTTSFLDRYRPALLDGRVFAADGRITPGIEPFEWGAWMQSPMSASVACSSCHDPHTGGLRHGEAPCAQCHTTRAASHPEGADCVGCHLPTTTYMGVQPRHDHGIGAHRDPTPFAAALAGEPAAGAGLLTVALDPGRGSFYRASALALLRRFPPSSSALALRDLATAPDALLRLEAVATLGAWGDADTAGIALADPARAVRFAAIEAYVSARGDAAQAPAFGVVLAEYEALGACDDDVPSVWQGLGRLRAANGDRPGAIHAYEQLQRLEPENPDAARALAHLRR